jgi:tetratricopeptide (TPR) repeat protein
MTSNPSFRKRNFSVSPSSDRSIRQRFGEREGKGEEKEELEGKEEKREQPQEVKEEEEEEEKKASAAWESEKKQLRRYCGTKFNQIDDKTLFEMPEFRKFSSLLLKKDQKQLGQMSRKQLCSEVGKFINDDESEYAAYVPYEKIVIDSSEKIPSWSYDAVSQELMLNPFAVSSGRSYSKETIDSLPSINVSDDEEEEKFVKIDPMNREHIVGNPYVNWNLESAIDEMLLERTGFTRRNLLDSKALVENEDQREEAQGKDEPDFIKLIHYYELLTIMPTLVSEKYKKKMENLLYNAVVYPPLIPEFLKMLELFQKYFPIPSLFFRAKIALSMKDNESFEKMTGQILSIKPNNIYSVFIYSDYLIKKFKERFYEINDRDIEFIKKYATINRELYFDFLEKLVKKKKYKQVLLEIEELIEETRETSRPLRADFASVLAKFWAETSEKIGIPKDEIVKTLKSRIYPSPDENFSVQAADIFYKLGAYKDALHYYESALTIDPDNNDAIEGRAKALYKLDKQEKDEEKMLKAFLQPPSAESETDTIYYTPQSPSYAPKSRFYAHR